MNSRVRVERSQLVQEITPGGYVRESQRVCISGYGKGIIVIRFRSEFFCTTKWLCQFDAVCSTASSQTSRRRLCTLLVSTSIIHMISDQRHIKEDLSWCHSLGLPFFLSEVPVCKLLCRASARLS